MPPRNKPRRSIEIGNPTCLLHFDGRDAVPSGVFDSSTLTPGGVNERQTVAITGTPTGGTFKLKWNGQTTANIAYNATGAAVRDALRALSRIGSTGIDLVSGGALPGTPVVLEFVNALGKDERDPITVAATALTGGTSPAVAVTETRKGSSKFAGLYVLQSGLPLMQNGDGSALVEWDGASAATLVGIFDGQRELFGPGDNPIIPVYSHGCVFDKDVVKNYATYAANYETWAASHACQFAYQGDES